MMKHTVWKRTALWAFSLMLAVSFTLPPVSFAWAAEGQTELEEAAELHNLAAGDALSAYDLYCTKAAQGKNNTVTPTVNDFYINLYTEKLYAAESLPDDAPSMFISTDGGERWKPITVSKKSGDYEGGTDISKLLNKGGVLMLCTSVTGKKPTVAADAEKDEDGNEVTEAVSGANVYTLGSYGARPKAPKAKLDYSKYADKTGATNGQWTLDIDTKNLQIAPTADKKNPSTGVYMNFKDGEGVAIFDCGAKVIKTNYILRVAPNIQTRTPASKLKKVSVSSTLKPTNFKVDYKAELIKTKAGAIYVTGTGETDSEGEVTYSWVNTAALKVFDKDSAKTGVKLVSTAQKYDKNGEITSETSQYGSTLLFRMSATDKKPASAIQQVTVAERKRMYEADFTLTVNNGSCKVPSGMEYYNSSKSKWVTGTIKEPGDYEFRFKNTAKHTPKTDATSGNATSLPILVSLIEGKYGKTEKTGLVDYEVKGFPRYAGLVVGRVKQPAGDEDQDRHAYTVYPKDYFATAGYEKTVTIDLLGLMNGTGLRDTTGEADLAFAKYENDGSMSENTVYIEAKLEHSGTGTGSEFFDIKSVTVSNSQVVLTLEAGESEDFPKDGTTFTVELILHEKEGQDLALRDKFYCRPVVFTFAVPSMALELKASSALTFTISGESKALMTTFDGSGTAFQDLNLENVPQLRIFNKTSNAWSAGEHQLKFSNSSTDNKLLTSDTDGSDFLETDNLNGKLKYYQFTTVGDIWNGWKNAEHKYFFVEDKEGNLYPFRLVEPIQEDVNVTYTNFDDTISQGSYNTIKLSIDGAKNSYGKFAATTGTLNPSLFTVKLGSSANLADTLTVVKANVIDGGRTVVLHVNSVMNISEAIKYLNVGVKKEAFDGEVTVKGTDIKATAGKLDETGLIASASGVVSGYTIIATVTLNANNEYRFDTNISTSTRAASAAYLTVPDSMYGVSVTNVQITNTTATTMTIAIVTNGNPTNTSNGFNITFNRAAFSPKLISATKDAPVTFN